MVGCHHPLAFSCVIAIIVWPPVPNVGKKLHLIKTRRYQRIVVLVGNQCSNPLKSINKYVFASNLHRNVSDHP